MKVLLLLMIVAVAQEPALKPTDEFEIKLDYQFKQRSLANANAVHINETRKDHERRTSTDLLPYLVLNVKMLKVSPAEVRALVSSNKSQKVANKKIAEGTVLTLDLGFTVDVKDRVNAHQYTIQLLSPEKTETSRIVINVDEDGSFFVNGEKRGRF